MILNKERVSQRVFDLGIDLSSLARKAKVSKASLARFLKGAEINDVSLASLAEALTVKPDWLIDPAPLAGQIEPRTIADRLAQISSILAGCNKKKIEQDFLLKSIVDALEFRIRENK